MDVSFPVFPITGRELTVEQIATRDDRNVKASASLVEIQAAFLHIEGLLSPNVPEEVRKRLGVARQLATHAWFAYEFHAVSFFWSLTVVEMGLKLKFEQVVPQPYKLEHKEKLEDGTQVVRTKEGNLAFFELQRLLGQKWKLKGKGLKQFDGSLRSLLWWARSTGVLPADTAVRLGTLQTRFDNRCGAAFVRHLFESGVIDTPTPDEEEVTKHWNALRKHDQLKHRGPGRPVDVIAEELATVRNKHAHPGYVSWLLPPGHSIQAYWQAAEILNGLWPA